MIDGVLLVAAATLIGLGAAAAILRCHRLAAVVGGQLAGLGAVLLIVALLGADGTWFAAIVAGLSAAAGALVATLQRLDGQQPSAPDEADPLRW